MAEQILGVHEIGLSGVRLIDLKTCQDFRGLFREAWNAEALRKFGLSADFVQDSVSISHEGVIRGMHWQAPPYEQIKMVQCLHGAIIDVVVDIRVESPTFGTCTSMRLSGDDRLALWIPEGFAHGFGALEEHSVVLYKCSAPYMPSYSFGIAYNDPSLELPWKSWGFRKPVLSDRDRTWPGIYAVTAERRLTEM